MGTSRQTDDHRSAAVGDAAAPLLARLRAVFESVPTLPEQLLLRAGGTAFALLPFVLIALVAAMGGDSSGDGPSPTGLAGVLLLQAACIAAATVVWRRVPDEVRHPQVLDRVEGLDPAAPQSSSLLRGALPLAWAVERRLVSDELRARASGPLAAFEQGSITAVELYRQLGCVLRLDMLAPRSHGFFRWYFRPRGRWPSRVDRDVAQLADRHGAGVPGIQEAATGLLDTALDRYARLPWRMRPR